MSAWRDAGIAAVVLAAGGSGRMGEPKLLLPHPADGAPLLRHSVGGVLALEPLEVVVVLRHDLPALGDALTGLTVRPVPNPDFAEGMSTSLRAALAALTPEAEAALVVLGDTPDVPASVFAALLSAYLAARRRITISVYGDISAPPTIFSRAAFPALASLTGDQGGRRAASLHPEWVERVEFPAEMMPADVDTRGDYEKLRGG
ncbi:MAG: nucleotidyltransferase family protein [Chloroflexia bacterium]